MNNSRVCDSITTTQMIRQNTINSRNGCTMQTCIQVNAIPGIRTTQASMSEVRRTLCAHVAYKYSRTNLNVLHYIHPHCQKPSRISRLSLESPITSTSTMHQSGFLPSLQTTTGMRIKVVTCGTRTARGALIMWRERLTRLHFFSLRHTTFFIPQASNL